MSREDSSPKKKKRTMTQSDSANKESVLKKTKISAPPASASVAAAAAATTTTTSVTNPQAERLAQKLRQQQEGEEALLVEVTYLTEDAESWLIHVKRWFPTPSPAAFSAEWDLHPTTRHEIQVFGKKCLEKRWSQSWGYSYEYSGSVNNATQPLTNSTLIPYLLNIINGFFVNDNDNDNANHNDNKDHPYNGCLQNWYTPQDSIGLHADDERNLNSTLPIWSLSWGGTRRFLLRPKNKVKGTAPQEVWLADGDLLLMGGTCQTTHKHEVPKVRSTMDPATSNRISWTIRAFQNQEQTNNTTRGAEKIRSID